MPLQASPLNPPSHAKITRNEAEHIALKKFPGAHVTSAKLQKMQGNLVWMIDIAIQKNESSTRVEVDAMTGRVLSAANKKP
ncbi:MAG: PepSY domain-containing protein [Chthoniobacterales bacterium]